jgi:translation initiation factor 3 subunit C
LCKKIYSLKNANLQRQRSLLCQIYHHSLHDRWDKAKELLLMSHAQAIIDHSEASTQVSKNNFIRNYLFLDFVQSSVVSTWLMRFPSRQH